MKIRLGPMIAALVLLTGSATQAEPSQKLVTILTSEDAQTQLMAMVLTMQAVQSTCPMPI